MSKSSVTYSPAGIAMFGDATRSKRVGLPVPPTPSFALAWNNPFDDAPQNVLFVVHGTMFAPPAWMVAQPAGSEPAGTPLKFSEKIVVGIGVPVCCVKRTTLEPTEVEIVSASSSGVPGTND